jgi:hypothetical protein
MGVRLMIEVLDHYHGPPRHKLWLIAFAESARDRTRRGWVPRYKLAHRADVSGPRASNIAAALIAEGVVKRHGGGYHGQAAIYELLPLAERAPLPERPVKGSPRPNPSKGSEWGPKGSESGPKGSPRPNPIPQSPHIPSSARARARGPARIIRAAYPDATDDEIEKIIEDRASHGARNLPAVLAYEARERTLLLPCDRDSPSPHSNACRDGDGSGCGVKWCACRCHTPAEAETAP